MSNLGLVSTDEESFPPNEAAVPANLRSTENQIPAVPQRPEGNEIIPLNDETQIAVPPNENQVALRSSENQIALPSSANELALVSNRNLFAGPQESEVVIAGGSFKKINFGPQTNKNKQVNKAYNYSNAKITEHHHHYYGATGRAGESTSNPTGARRKERPNIRRNNEEPSTSGTQDSERRAAESFEFDEDYTQLSDDIFMYNKSPLKPGTKIYKGFQRHASGDVRLLAIKLLLPYTEKNLKEVKHLLKLSYHSNVVQIIHSKEQKSPVPSLYIAMELCSLKNLRDYFDENRENNIPLDVEKTMSITKKLVAGLKFIHRNKIIHRDLKPENILFSTDNEEIKIADFGISKELKHGCSVTKQSSLGLGTDGYRAPETYNSDVISMSTDIYSLGLTLHSLWTDGKHPFGDDPYLLNYNIKENKGLDLSGLPDELGPRKNLLRDLLSRMLRFDPRERPTIEEVFEHLFFSSPSTPLVQERPSAPVFSLSHLNDHLQAIPVTDLNQDEAFDSFHHTEFTEETIPKEASWFSNSPQPGSPGFTSLDDLLQELPDTHSDQDEDSDSDQGEDSGSLIAVCGSEEDASSVKLSEDDSLSLPLDYSTDQIFSGEVSDPDEDDIEISDDSDDGGLPGASRSSRPLQIKRNQCRIIITYNNETVLERDLLYLEDCYHIFYGDRAQQILNPSSTHRLPGIRLPPLKKQCHTMLKILENFRSGIVVWFDFNTFRLCAKRLCRAHVYCCNTYYDTRPRKLERNLSETLFSWEKVSHHGNVFLDASVREIMLAVGVKPLSKYHLWTMKGLKIEFQLNFRALQVLVTQLRMRQSYPPILRCPSAMTSYRKLY